MSRRGTMVLMGFLATVLAACGIGSDSEGPRAPEVVSGQAGLEQIQSEAVDLLRDLVPQVTDATGLVVDSAVGAYRSSGYSGSEEYWEYSARAELSGREPDRDALATILRDAGLEVSTYETPQGYPAVQGRGGGINAVVFIEPDDDSAQLRVTRSGARIESDPVEFPAERQAELREEAPIDLG